jgi:DNA-binding transcriptional LysR family regulator
VIAALMNQQVEFAVTTLLHKPSELTTEVIASDPFVAICGAKHPLATQRRVTWALMRDQRLVGFKASSSTRRQLDEALARQKIELNWFDEVDQLSSLVGYLRSGYFVGVVPRLLARYLLDVVTLDVAGQRIDRRIYLARRRDSPLSTSALALWRSVAAVATDAKAPRQLAMNDKAEPT